MKRLPVFALFLFVACASVPPGGDAEVRTAMNGFLEALNALDAGAINAHFAPDATAFFPVVASERVNGKEAISEIFRTYVTETRKNVQRTNIVAEEMRIERSGDLAVASFQVHNPSAVSRRSFVLRREGGRWLIVHMHASNFRTAS
ncbi:MAG TPA: nuclear transport factor 2 family protein [Thermoanaerobaculia bacterium]|jgi:uncharacterized protein (TIGR02246 family)